MAASLKNKNKVNQNTYDLDINDYTSDDSVETTNFGFMVDSEDEEDDEYIPNNENNLKRLKSQNGGNLQESEKMKRQLQRRPTRRPDPKVFNRNALMARENRQRKKQQMENMETQMQIIKDQNRQLKKIAKHQGTLITKLTNEKSYLRSVISNKTEILQLLKQIQPTKLPITSSAVGLMTDNEFTRNIYTPPNSCSPNSNNFEENSSNGTAHPDPFLSDTQIIENNFFFTDFDLPTPSNNLDGWESLLNSNYKISDIPELNDENSTKCNINNEHNYFLNNNLSQNTIEPGVCLHVNGGRVSLEFCESCHTNAQNAWIEEM